MRKSGCATGDHPIFDRSKTCLIPRGLGTRPTGPYFGTPTATAAESTVIELTATTAERPEPRASLAVCDLSDGRLIGRVSWYWESRQTDWRWMGLVIYDKRYRGGGFGTEALRLWTTYLFSRTDTLRLDFATYSGNPGMITVGRRLGSSKKVGSGALDAGPAACTTPSSTGCSARSGNS